MASTKKIGQEWFELRDVRRRNSPNRLGPFAALSPNRTDWPRMVLLVSKKEFSGAGSLAIPLSRREQALKLGWDDIGLSLRCVGARRLLQDRRGTRNSSGEPLGIQLVLVQIFDNEPTEWHLNQDLVIALALKREGDQWLRPEERLSVVTRLVRNEEGDPVALEIKNEFLRDYLASRKMLNYGFPHAWCY